MSICNMCGRKLNEKIGANREECVRIIKDWGYFSKKDLQTHEIILCEQCYDELIKKFVVPIKVIDRNEVL